MLARPTAGPDLKSVALPAFDQAISSGANYLTLILVARTVANEVDFGQFGLMLAVSYLSIEVCRAYILEPLLYVEKGLLFGHLLSSRMIVRACGLSVAVSLIFWPALIGGSNGLALAVSLSVACLFASIFELLRGGLLADSETATAICADLVWLGWSVSFILLLGGSLTPVTGILAWASGALLATVVILLTVPAKPRPEISRFSEGRGLRYAVEVGLERGSGTAAIAIASLVASPALVAPLLAARVLLGPLTTSMALVNVLGSRRMLLAMDFAGARAIQKLSRLFSAVLMVLALVPALAVGFLPAVGDFAFGVLAESVRDLLVPMALWGVAMSIRGPARVALRVLGRERLVTVVRAMGAIVTVVTFFLVAATFPEAPLLVWALAFVNATAAFALSAAVYSPKLRHI